MSFFGHDYIFGKWADRIIFSVPAITTAIVFFSIFIIGLIKVISFIL